MPQADKAVHMASMIWVSPELKECMCVCFICVSPDEAHWLLQNTVLRGVSCLVESLMEEARDKRKEERVREGESGNGRKMFGHVDCMCLKAWRDDSKHPNSVKIYTIHRECYLCIWFTKADLSVFKVIMYHVCSLGVPLYRNLKKKRSWMFVGQKR